MKLQYQNGKITDKQLNNYNCQDNTDMQILCDKINKYILKKEIENKKLATQLELIKEILNM